MADTDSTVCGHPTDDGTPCQNPATEGDHCWIKSHGGDVTPGRDREPPSKATQETIATHIENGSSIQEACRRAGVHREQFYRWMQYGDEEDAGPFQEFRDRLVRARGEGEAEYREALIEIAKETGDTATLMSMLKQRYPESWGDVDRGEQAGGVVVKTDADETVEIDPESLEIEE